MRTHAVLRKALTRQPASIVYRPSTLLRASQRRFASSGPQQSSSSSSSKPTSNYADFYKTFTRPLAKTMLLAVFTYQLVYWAWVKLETDEVKAERNAEIAGLEAQVKSLQEAQKSK